MEKPKSFFLKETFETMKASLEAQDRYYFVDAVHPTHNPVLGYSWSPRGQRPQVLSNTARQRLNILGAYNPSQQTYVGLETTESINAQSLIDLLRQLETHQPHGRIILICDNARYNHARLVREYLQQTASRVELLFLPPYSPNLNLIERLWGLMKERILRDYYPTFAGFRQAISTFFSQLDDYADDLASLMTENFQILNSV
jgi:transposase